MTQVDIINAKTHLEGSYVCLIGMARIVIHIASQQTQISLRMIVMKQMEKGYVTKTGMGRTARFIAKHETIVGGIISVMQWEIKSVFNTGMDVTV